MTLRLKRSSLLIMRSGFGAKLSLALALTVGSCTFADVFVVSYAGAPHLEEIRQSLPDTSLLLDTERSGLSVKNSFRGTVVATRRPSDMSAPRDSAAGSPILRIRLFPLEGDLDGTFGGEVIELPDAWLDIDNEVDSFYDLRLLFSNRDETLGYRIGSSRYANALFAAVDPEGRLGLNTMGQPDESDEGSLVEGSFVKRLKYWQEIPFSNVSHQEFSMDEEYLAETSRLMEERRSKAWFKHGLVYPPTEARNHVLDASVWIETIARIRRYGYYEPGLERAMLALLGAQLRFARVDATDNYSAYVREQGVHLRGAIVDLIRFAAGARQSEGHLGWFTERQALGLQRPVHLTEATEVALDLVLAYPEVLNGFKPEAEAEMELKNNPYSFTYTKAEFTGLAPIDFEMPTIEEPRSLFEPVLAPELPTSREVPSVSPLDLLYLTVDPWKVGLEEPIDLKSKASSALLLQLRGEMGDLSSDYDYATEYARMYALEEITDDCMELAEWMLMPSGGEIIEAEPFWQRLGRAYAYWQNLIGILSAAEWPGRPEAYEEFFDRVVSRMSGLASNHLNDIENGNTVYATNELERLDMRVHFFRAFERLQGDSAAERLLLDEVRKWKENFIEAYEAGRASEWTSLMVQRYLKVSSQ